jgi:hypothetical protein
VGLHGLDYFFHKTRLKTLIVLYLVLALLFRFFLNFLRFFSYFFLFRVVPCFFFYKIQQCTRTKYPLLRRFSGFVGIYVDNFQDPDLEGLLLPPGLLFFTTARIEKTNNTFSKGHGNEADFLGFFA